VVGESLILALAGALLSLLFSSWSLALILSNMPGEAARYIAGWNDIQIDARWYSLPQSRSSRAFCRASCRRCERALK
jgi:hypothetical protein